MKTALLITACLLAAWWVLSFILDFVPLVERCVCEKDFTNVHFVKNKNGYYGKILSYSIFWTLVIRTYTKRYRILMYLTGAPIWGFLLYIIIEAMIISGKKIYRWLSWL